MESTETIVEKKFIVGDTETTGLKDPRACEVGLMQIDPTTFEVLHEVSSLIDPEKPIEPGAMAIHGITDEMVADKPTMAEFLEHCGGRIPGALTMIAHNLRFDIPMLEPVGVITRTICSLNEARAIKHLMPGLENCKLQTLREYFGIAANNAHRALADCDITRQVLKKLCDISGRTLDQLADVTVRTVHIMPFGKHVGTPIMSLPRSYLEYMLTLDLDKNLRTSMQKSLDLK